MMSIYLIMNLVNQKVYVGQTTKTVNARWKAHLSSAANGKHGRLYSAIRKYGTDKFSIQTISIATTLDHLNYLEEYFVRQFKANDSHYGYNLTVGGNGLPSPCEETRRKISTRLMGNRNGLGNNSPGRRGQHLSKEHCQKISAANKGKSRGIGNKNALGKKHFNSLGTRKKLSIALMGHSVSEETRRKISIRLMGNRNQSAKRKTI